MVDNFVEDNCPTLAKNNRHKPYYHRLGRTDDDLIVLKSLVDLINFFK